MAQVGYRYTSKRAWNMASPSECPNAVDPEVEAEDAGMDQSITLHCERKRILTAYGGPKIRLLHCRNPSNTAPIPALSGTSSYGASDASSTSSAKAASVEDASLSTSGSRRSTCQRHVPTNVDPSAVTSTLRGEKKA